MGNHKNKFKKLILGQQNVLEILFACKHFLVASGRVVFRIGFLGLAFVVYFLQLFALGLQKKYLAVSLLEFFSRLLLHALGIRVSILDQNNSLYSRTSQPCIYIFNHRNPLDIFVIQGHLRMPGITTAGLHLGWVLPWFSLSASNAGHVLMNHTEKSSRRSAIHGASEVIRKYGCIIIAPNGSLKTSILQRVSASALILARKHQSSIIPLFFSYSNLMISDQDLYKPLVILGKRLSAPLARIECAVGMTTDLDCPADSGDREGFTRAVQAYYRKLQESG